MTRSDPTILSSLTKESGKVLGALHGLIDRRIVLLGVGDLIEPLVRLLLLCGAKVCISRYNPATLSKNLEEFSQYAWSEQHLTGITCDASSDDQVAAVVAHTAGAFGGIDAALYGVGAIMQNANAAPDGTILDIDPDAVLRQINADAMGGLRFAKALKPHLRGSFDARGERPCFILIGSIGPGVNGSACQTRSFGYNCAKSATHILMQMLSHESEFGAFCQMLIVAPGPIRTKLNWERMATDQPRGKTALERTAAGEFCAQDDPAGVCFAAIAGLLKGVAGQMICVDNGLTGNLVPY